MTPRGFISTPPEIAVGRTSMREHFTKTTSLFLPVDGEASWPLLPVSVSLLSGGTVQPGNTFLYPQGDTRGQRKPKKDKHQH